MLINDYLDNIITKLGGDPATVENQLYTTKFDKIIELIDDLMDELDEKSEVEVTPVVTEGTKIATITVNGTAVDLFIPAEQTEG